MRRFIWGYVNYENNSKPHSRLKTIQLFYTQIKAFCGMNISKIKRKTTWKADWIGSYSWYFRTIKVKCVSKRNRVRYSTPVCMIPRLMVTNDDRFVLKFVWHDILVISICRFFLEYIFFYTFDVLRWGRVTRIR